MEKTTKQLKTWRVIAILSLCAFLTVSILYAFGVGYKETSPSIDETKVPSLWNKGTGAKNSLPDYADIFPSWNLESTVLRDLVSYVSACTDPSSPDYLSLIVQLS